MSLYDEIKSPFFDLKNLEKIINIYATGRVDSGSRKIENSTDLYSRILIYGSDNENNEYQNYIDNFNKYIKNPSFDTYFGNLKKFNDKNQLSIQQEGKNIINRFKDYYEFSDYYSQNISSEVEKLFEKCDIYPNHKNEYINNLQQLGLSENKIKELNDLYQFKKGLNKNFCGGSGIMGFHIHPQILLSNIEKEREKTELKLYVNAGSDTYKVAQMFQQQCINEGLNYYYKVANPERTNEYIRNDKMCIYSEFKDAEKFANILKMIKKENPDIKFKEPPLLTGTVDDFIGIGTDKVSGKKRNI